MTDQPDISTTEETGVSVFPDLPAEAWRPDFGDDEPTLETAVFLALGSASMCWENPAGAGTFWPEKATWIGNGLLAWMAEHPEIRPT